MRVLEAAFLAVLCVLLALVILPLAAIFGTRR